MRLRLSAQHLIIEGAGIVCQRDQEGLRLRSTFPDESFRFRIFDGSSVGGDRFDRLGLFGWAGLLRGDVGGKDEQEDNNKQVGTGHFHPLFTQPK